jgi:hypothetical protein
MLLPAIRGAPSAWPQSAAAPALVLGPPMTLTKDSARHFCRNPRCRTKLPRPVENVHHAFCTPGCHTSFYRSRCLVCEEPMKRKRGNQRLKSGHKTCEQEYRRFPGTFELLVGNPLPTQPNSDESSRCAHLTGLKTRLEGERPSHRSLRHWSWHFGPSEHELRNAHGTLVACIRPEGDGWWVAQPHMIPEPPIESLKAAQHRAESAALWALPARRP